MRRLLLFISLLVSVNLYSQDIVDEYNKWLAKNELSKYLEARNMETEIQDGVRYARLNLIFQTSLDSAVSFWKEINQKYQQEKGFAFSDLLFYQYLYFAKSSKPDTLVIFVFDEPKNYVIAIYFDPDQKKVITQESTPLSESRIIDLDLSQIGLKRVQLKDARYTRDYIYQRILDFINYLYKQKGGIYGNVNKNQVRILDFGYNESKETLKVRVYRMKQEVLYDYGNDFLCNLINYFWGQKSCNPWEYLEFKFNYEDGKLTMDVEGKFSDGMASEPIRWKNANSMEPQFSGALSDYADYFSGELFKYLAQQKK